MVVTVRATVGPYVVRAMKVYIYIYIYICGRGPAESPLNCLVPFGHID